MTERSPREDWTPWFIALMFGATAFATAQNDGPRFGNGPWILLQRGAEITPASATRYTGEMKGATRIRLDDGRTALVTVANDPCPAGQRCLPADCGCLDQDRYRLSITDTAGAVITQTHVWAAYGAFDMVPVDLVEGPGEELLIVRKVGRSSPPNGLELKILQLAAGRAVELLPSHQIAGNLSGRPMGCGEWRGRVVVDVAAATPRPFVIRHDVVVPKDCVLDEPAKAEEIRRHRATLTFIDGRFRIQ